MRTVEVDRDADGFRVTWLQGARSGQVRTFATRVEAEAFALKKMGARGCVISSLDMSAAQLADLEARRARARLFMASLPA